MNRDPRDRLRRLCPTPAMREQIAQIAPSIIEFGWTNPVLIAGDGTVIAGHGRLDAARRLRLDAVPVLILDHLSERRASLNWREAINFRL
jgi:ParB-like chromosome segregation protein Spo0J